MTSWGKKGSSLRRSASELDGVDERAIPLFARQRRDNDGTKAFPILLGPMTAAATKVTKTHGLLQRPVGRSPMDRFLIIFFVGDDI